MLLPGGVYIEKGKGIFSAEKGMNCVIEGEGMTYQVKERSDYKWKNVRGMQ